MTNYLAAVSELLPDFIAFGTGGARLITLPDNQYSQWLSLTDGGVALQGAIRFFPAIASSGLCSFDEWNSVALWKDRYGKLAPDVVIFAEDAFGQQFGFEPNGSVGMFWSETGKIESLKLDFVEFIEAITHDPNGTVSFDLFRAATELLGTLPLTDHFAFKVETVLGGALHPDNVTKLNAVQHMRALGQIAQQISELPVGTKLKPTREQ